MKQAVTRELFSFWNSVRGSRSAPERADVDPAMIGHLLRDTFLLDIDGKAACPLRLSGSRMDALFVRSLKGESFLDLWRRADHGSVQSLISTALDDAAPVVIGASTAPPGREPFEVEVLLLPLRYHGKTHARLLGSLTPSYVPSWYGLLPAEPLRMETHRILDAEATGVAPESAATVGEPLDYPAPYAVARRARPGFLMVYEGGRDTSPR